MAWWRCADPSGGSGHSLPGIGAGPWGDAGSFSASPSTPLQIDCRAPRAPLPGRAPRQGLERRHHHRIKALFVPSFPAHVCSRRPAVDLPPWPDCSPSRTRLSRHSRRRPKPRPISPRLRRGARGHAATVTSNVVATSRPVARQWPLVRERPTEPRYPRRAQGRIRPGEKLLHRPRQGSFAFPHRSRDVRCRVTSIALATDERQALEEETGPRGSHR